MRDQDIPKVMKYIKENLDEIKQIIKFLEEQDTAAGTDKQSDPDDKFSDEDTHNVMDNDNDAGADEDTHDVMHEGEQEKAGTEHTSDGVDYPDVGDGTGVEGETLHEEDHDYDGGGDSDEQMASDDEALADAGIKEEEEVNEDEEQLEENGTPSVAVGAPTGPAVGVQGAQGSENQGIARVKSRMGKTQKRYDESKGVPLDGSADDVKAMMESWKSRTKYDPNMGGF